MVVDNENLFQEMSPAHYGENLRKRTLFLPKILEDKSAINKQLYENGKFSKAYDIICKWADIEKSGKLKPRKESNLEGEFFKDMFCDCLGYSLFSENIPRWEAEQKYAINGSQADGVIGSFSPYHKKASAVIELKGPTVNVDREKTNGRTPVQQCWDYLNLLPECSWGIVCNFVSFRLYHRNFTPKAYELFTLQELRVKENFKKFYYIFQRDGILPSPLSQIPRADELLERSTRREKDVGDNLYKDYRDSRINLIDYLMTCHNKSLDKAIYIAQKLIDRIVFIAFCEDKGLLPSSSLKKAWEQVPPFSKITNPKWQNFLELFHSIDKGNSNADISPYNGGLFKKDDEVDNLQLEDDKTNFFNNMGGYDFCGDINVEVLGHLFERSVHDIERIKTGDFFGENIKPENQVKMSTSAERKRFGIYYTPSDFTDFITYNTISKLAVQKFDILARQMGISRDDAETAENNPKAREYWKKCFGILQDIKIVDPACGSGAFLIKAYDLFEDLYKEVLHHLSHQGEKTDNLKESIPELILQKNIHGVDLSHEAVEITQLALWLRSAQKGKSLSKLSDNIICGNSLIEDQNIHPEAFNWKKAFQNVFDRPNGGFDCVIGNPPWDRMKLQEREFFDGRDTKIATAVSAAKRRELICKLEKRNPQLFNLYQKAQEQTEKNLFYIRNSGRYPLMGKGDINTYAVFAELAYLIVADDGLVGFLVPSGIATDNTTKDFFGSLINEKRLYGLYDFENRKKIFIDVDGRFKFSILLFGGKEQLTEDIDFLFFAHDISDLKDRNRHISLSPEEIKILNPNTQTCPIFRTRLDAGITKAIYKRVPVLIDKTRKQGGNPWGIHFLRMFDQTNDAELFKTAEEMKSDKYKRDGAIWKKGKKTFLPLYEAKMIQMYDHRAASIVINEENWMRQGQTSSATLVQHQNPEYTVEPRWWVDSNEVSHVFNNNKKNFFLAFKDITSATNTRTMISACIPWCAATNHLPIILTETSPRLTMCLLGNLNSFAFDFITRQKVGAVTLNYFIVEQLPIFTPDFYDVACPWDKKHTLEQWISERVLKLTCTSNDMIPLAEDAKFKPKVYKWKNEERLKLMAVLDAVYFLFYNIERVDMIYILSTFSGLTNQKESVFTDETSRLIIEYYDSFKKSI